MNGKKEHRRRYNEKLQYITDFEQWLEQEPRMIHLLWFCGTPYFISDIGMRFFTPRELYNAMGFPPDYIIDRDPYGNQISRKDQVARCGNAVCPAISEALVRANLPEECKQKIETMEDLKGAMLA